jgi:DNA helicase HerA-like ATPase
MSTSSPGTFRLGAAVDPESHDRLDEQLLYESGDLTTHGVIVGMTGSGKTGLAIDLLEEALSDGIPTLVIDPKGDMGNLLLTFPQLRPEDFRPWIDERVAEQQGQTADEFAAAQAQLWTEGLAGWNLGSADIAALRDGAHFTIYTPGSDAGVPLDLIGSLSAPSDGDSEDRRDRIESAVSSLLALLGIEADPLSSPEHILLANLIDHAWTAGLTVDLASLVGMVQDPPIRKLGVLELDSFYPKDDRTKLALKLNGLLASPAFASWNQGVPLDIERLLYRDGKPGAAIISIAHLGEQERQFVVTLVLTELISWMRRQPGTSELRALVYMDEVFGFVPPTANPPAKKPILTILKQARAFGVGMVLASQNPVDLDYKAISNAGTWWIGRLQTEQDKGRLMDGLRTAAGSADVDLLSTRISGLAKREFVQHSTRSSEPALFGTRWAMSYLRGPMTRDEIARLRPEDMDAPDATPPASTGAPAAGTPAGAAAATSEHTDADDATPVMPEIADGTVTTWLDPAAEWAVEVEAVPGSTRFEAGVAARVHLIYDETKADDLRHEEEYECVLFPLSGPFDPEAALSVDYDDRDLRSDAPAGPTYALVDARVDTKTWFNAAKTALRDHLVRSRSLTIPANRELKVYGRPGESDEDFRERCAVAADAGADEAKAKIAARFEKRRDTLEQQYAAAQDRVAEAQVALEDKQDQEKMNVLAEGANILGGLLGMGGRRRSAGAAARSASSKRGQKARAAQRLTSAENRVADKLAAIEELDADVIAEIEDIDLEWDDKMEAIEQVEISLEKSDVTVDDLQVVWIPR